MADFKLLITPTTVVDLSEGQILDLNRSLGRLATSLPMSNFKVMQLPSGKYKYQFDTVDGRHWEQNLEVLPDLIHNFHCDFDKIEGDQWSEVEFAP